MRFKVDENLHDDVAMLLVQHGHEAHTVHDENLRGCNDNALYQRCSDEDRVLVTLDLDFADLRAFPPASSAGIIVIRVHSQSRGHILTVLTKAIELFDREPIVNRLWIVSEGSVRIRES